MFEVVLGEKFENEPSFLVRNTFKNTNTTKKCQMSGFDFLIFVHGGPHCASCGEINERSVVFKIITKSLFFSTEVEFNRKGPNTGHVYKSTYLYRNQ